MISFRVLRNPLVAVAMASMAVCSQAAGNLLINGDFEADIASITGPNFYTTVNAGQPGIFGWTVGGTSVDLIIAPYYGAITSVSVDLDGTPGPGTLSQSFNQVVGQTYTLVWDYFRNPPGSNLGVKFGDLSPVTYTNVSLLTSYVTESLTYVAASTGVASLTFTSSGGSGGPTIDNVSVTAVPEPEGIVLAVAALTFLGALRTRRAKA